MRYLIPQNTAVSAAPPDITDNVDYGDIVYLPWVIGTSGSNDLKVSSSKLLFIPSTGNLIASVVTAASFSGGSVSGTTITGTILSDSKGDVRTAPQIIATGAYVLQSSDSGKHISISGGGVTVPTSIFNIGEMVMIFNNSSSDQDITTTGTTCYLSGTNLVGNRTLSQRGTCTILCVGVNTFAISGAGLL